MKTVLRKQNSRRLNSKWGIMTKMQTEVSRRFGSPAELAVVRAPEEGLRGLTGF
jgi:hypothetical protein